VSYLAAYTVDGLLLAAILVLAVQLVRLRERLARLEGELGERLIRPGRG
jgi:hypothetical protein